MRKEYIIYGGEKRLAIKTNCIFCGKGFLKAKVKFKGHDKHFCSTRCMNDSKKNRIQIKCESCGKIINRKPSKLKNKTGFYFCSHECADKARKTENGSLISTLKHGGYIEYRNKALNYYGKKCSHCDYDEYEEGLDVHHIDGNRKNNAIENLLVLCVLCHALVERKIYKVINRELMRADSVIGNTQN